MATRRKLDRAKTDLRDLPSYTIAEAAQYLGLPRTTLTHWVQLRGLIQPATRQPLLLSFMNLVEAFVLSSIRRKHQVPMQRARKALVYVQTHLGLDRPLINLQFQTDGIDLFVTRFGALVNASRGSEQLLLKQVLESNLHRIEWDKSGLARRLFPLVRKNIDEQPKAIVIDPNLGFGRPVLVGTGVRTEVVVERYSAGESTRHLASDYGVSTELIEDAIRSVLRAAA